MRLRSDNMSALVLFSRLKTHSKQLSVIARELALDLGAAAFRPEVAQHLPGISNVIADQLSRRFQPGKVFALRPSLAKAKAVVPPPRKLSWWKSLAGLPMPATPRAEQGARASKRARNHWIMPFRLKANTALAGKSCCSCRRDGWVMVVEGFSGTCR